MRVTRIFKNLYSRSLSKTGLTTSFTVSSSTVQHFTIDILTFKEDTTPHPPPLPSRYTTAGDIIRYITKCTYMDTHRHGRCTRVERSLVECCAALTAFPCWHTHTSLFNNSRITPQRHHHTTVRERRRGTCGHQPAGFSRFGAVVTSTESRR